MRKTFNVSKKIQKELEIQFSDLIDLCKGLKNKKHFMISVFNKQLTDEEASQELNDAGYSVKNAAERDFRLHSFCKELYENTICFKVKKIGIRRKKVQFKRFSTIENAVLSLKPKPYFYSDQNRFILALPEYDAVYFESCDFTHHLYCNDERSIGKIEELAIKSGLFVSLVKN